MILQPPELQHDSNLSAPYERTRTEIGAMAAYLPAIATQSADIFESEFFARLESIVSYAAEVPDARASLIDFCLSSTAAEVERSEIVRHIRHWPLGYPGDYQLIDDLYTQRAESGGIGSLWDEFVHRQAAPRAVRYRTELFARTFVGLCRRVGHAISVLNVASGPCREILEAVHQAGSLADGCLFHCVDSDARAAAFAQRLLKNVSPEIIVRWEVEDAFNLYPDRKYELVWCAGLFDYLNDRQATWLLQQMWEWTAPGGTLMVGNYRTGQPSRALMEWLGGWLLQHRSEGDMRRLFVCAGIPSSSLELQHDPQGVHIYGIARSDARRDSSQ